MSSCLYDLDTSGGLMEVSLLFQLGKDAQAVHNEVVIISITQIFTWLSWVVLVLLLNCLILGNPNANSPSRWTEKGERKKARTSIF